MKTIKVAPWGLYAGMDGPWATINESDFDPTLHRLYDEAAGAPTAEAPPMSRAEIKAALKARGVAFKGNASTASLRRLLEG